MANSKSRQYSLFSSNHHEIVLPVEDHVRGRRRSRPQQESFLAMTIALASHWGSLGNRKPSHFAHNQLWENAANGNYRQPHNADYRVIELDAILRAVCAQRFVSS